MVNPGRNLLGAAKALKLGRSFIFESVNDRYSQTYCRRFSNFNYKTLTEKKA